MIDFMPWFKMNNYIWSVFDGCFTISMAALDHSSDRHVWSGGMTTFEQVITVAQKAAHQICICYVVMLLLCTNNILMPWQPICCCYGRFYLPSIALCICYVVMLFLCTNNTLPWQPICCCYGRFYSPSIALCICYDVICYLLCCCYVQITSWCHGNWYVVVTDMLLSL